MCARLHDGCFYESFSFPGPRKDKFSCGRIGVCRLCLFACQCRLFSSVQEGTTQSSADSVFCTWAPGLFAPVQTKKRIAAGPRMCPPPSPLLYSYGVRLHVCLFCQPCSRMRVLFPRAGVQTLFLISLALVRRASRNGAETSAFPGTTEPHYFVLLLLLLFGVSFRHRTAFPTRHRFDGLQVEGLHYRR